MFAWILDYIVKFFQTWVSEQAIQDEAVTIKQSEANIQSENNDITSLNSQKAQAETEANVLVEKIKADDLTIAEADKEKLKALGIQPNVTAEQLDEKLKGL
jgi:hypothetical protein